jgi:hypothetical protein
MADEKDKVTEGILGTRQSNAAFETFLKTDERVLARIMDGIYRQPSSALRELISNAYDADATEVVVLTDYPRFQTISVRDNGVGFTAKSMAHMITSIGGSGKRRKVGATLGQTSADDPDKSRGGRKLIGKLGIGLFSVAQLTRHFLIITKVKGEAYRTVADITLVDDLEEDAKSAAQNTEKPDIAKAHARIRQEPATDVDSQGTEVILLDVLSKTRTELSGWLRWQRIDAEIEEDGKASTKPPVFHIGKFDPNRVEPEIIKKAELPWEGDIDPVAKFRAFVDAIRGQAYRYGDVVDLDVVCDNYLQSLWALSLSVPLAYLDGHPFDLGKGHNNSFYTLENKTRGQATELKLGESQTLRNNLNLVSPELAPDDIFRVVVDGVELLRPISFNHHYRSATGPDRSMLFVGRLKETFPGLDRELSGGTLDFEAYLYWTPKVIPKQHQGVMIRINNAAATQFDRTFMGYQVSEQVRLRQIVAEIYVREGLDEALNLDRESFNTSHPHYQLIMKWLHSAIRQLTNKNKAVGKGVRDSKREVAIQAAQAGFSNLVKGILNARDVEEIAQVKLLSSSQSESVEALREEGYLVFLEEQVLPPRTNIRTSPIELAVRKKREEQTVAIVQLLHSEGLLDTLSFEEQTRLVRDIMLIATAE